MKLKGKRAVVTGASQGLGRVIAEALLNEGASVLICARGSAGLEEARATLAAGHPGRVFAMPCDVAREQDLDALAARAAELFDSVDVLVCNAGVHGPKGPLETADWAGWVHAIQVNLLGTAYACRVFLPLLRKSKRGKILMLSGGGATKGRPFFSAYAAAKAANVRIAETLAEEVAADGIDVNAIAPGAMNTRLMEDIVAAGPEAAGQAEWAAAVKLQKTGGTPPELAARLCVYLASEEGDGVTGRLLSAQWDPWERLAEFKDELARTDVYTLRRIVPKERGKEWE